MTTSPPALAPPPSRRQRLREQTRAEIKDAARRQVAEHGGAGGLSLNALARSLGMAGPSLYRYFDSRDALLTELLVDAYTALAEALEASVRVAGGEPELPAAQALRRYADAYRAWALQHPELYELLLGAPVPGYVAPEEGTRAAAARGMAALLGVVERLLRERDGTGAERSAAPRAQDVTATAVFRAAVASAGAGEEVLRVALGLWGRVHGLVSLELHGHLQHMVTDPAALYDGEIDAVVRELGER